MKTIPPYKPISQDSHSSDSSPEKEGEPSSSGGTSLSPTVATIVTPPTATATNSSAKNTANKVSVKYKFLAFDYFRKINKYDFIDTEQTFSDSRIEISLCLFIKYQTF